MTEAEIRALDGEALTKLACALRLAPEASRDSGPFATLDCPQCGCATIFWEPHENVVQADALFRSLRTHPSIALETRTASSAEAGWCEVGRYGGLSTPRIYWGAAWEAYCAQKGLPCEKTEAMALVRVSVLAVILLGGESQ